MKSELVFPTRSQAEAFAIQWSRYSKTGHVIGSGSENVQVTLHDVTEDHQKWIDAYVEKLNK